MADERVWWYRCPECAHVWGETTNDPGRAWCCGCGTSASFPEPIERIDVGEYIARGRYDDAERSDG